MRWRAHLQGRMKKELEGVGKKEGQTCQDGVEVYSAWFVFDPFVIIIGVIISVE